MSTDASLPPTSILHKIITYFIASVWLINGLFCKVLDMTPRHREIVARILGDDHAVPLTKLIGASELLMFVWIISRLKPSLCAATQIFIVLLMNIIEYLTVPHLLLFGRINLLVAMAFCSLIYYNESVLYRKKRTAK